MNLPYIHLRPAILRTACLLSCLLYISTTDAFQIQAAASTTVVLQEGTGSVTGTEAASFDTSDYNFEDGGLLYFRYEYPNAVYFPVENYIPAGSTINSASLQIYVYEEYNTATANVECGYITDPDNTGLWHDRGDAGNGEGVGAAFGEKDAGNLIYWDNAEDNFDAVKSAKACGEADMQSTGWKTWDAATVVQGWMNGTHVNRGFWLQEASGAGSNTRAAGKYDETTSWRPKLTIEYTPPSSPPGSAPTLDTPSAGGSHSINLTWSSVSSVDGYKIRYGTSTGNYTTTVNVGKVNQYAVTGLTNGTTYYFVVAAYNYAGDGSNSTEHSAVAHYAPAQSTVLLQEGNNSLTGTEAAAFSTFDSTYEDATRLFFRWDYPNALYFPVLANVPSGATINSATLQTYVFEEYNTGVVNVECGYVTDPDNTGAWHDLGSNTDGSNAAANMGKKDAANTIYWDSAHDPFTSVMSAKACGQANVQTTGWKSWDATSIVQAWRSGTYANRGFWLREAADSGSNTRAAGKYDETAEWHPKLSITYTPATEVPASAPTVGTPTPGSQTVALSWSGVSDADGYKVKYGTSSGTYTTTIDVGNPTSYTVTGLTNGTTYYFVVVPYNTAGEGAASSQVSATPSSGAPSAPVLSSVDAGDHAVTLTWQTVTGAVDYRVKFGTTTGTYTQIITAGNVLSYQVINLTNGTPYYFVVTALNSGGTQSSVSNEISATPAPSVSAYGSDQCNGGTSSASSCFQGCGGTFSDTKAFDNNFTQTAGWVANGSTGWLEYQFTSPKTIGQYTISPRQQSGSNPKNWTFEGFDSSTSQWVVLDTRTNQTTSTWSYLTTRPFAFNNLNAYSRYRINVSANDGHSDMGVTEVEMMELTSTAAPSEVGNLQATAGSGSATLSWSEPANNGSTITGYQIQYGTVASGNFSVLQMDDATPGATVTGLINGLSYQFRVIAINANGTSDPSNTATATPNGTVIGITGNSVSSNRFFDPRQSESATIQYTLGTASDVTIKIYSYPADVLVRTLVDQASQSVGFHSETWDGRDDNNTILPEGGYIYRVEAAASGGGSGGYDPSIDGTGAPSFSNVSSTPSSSFEPVKGQRLQVNYDVSQPAKVTLVYGTTTVFEDKHRTGTGNADHWDGRVPGGDLVSATFGAPVKLYAVPLPENIMEIVYRTSLDIDTLTTDPYVMRPLFNDITTIAYDLTQSATVTVEIRTPDGATVLKTLLTSASQSSGSHTLQWDGRTDSGKTVADEGNYRVRVQAVDSLGTTVVRDGTIRILY